jgi:hypothetical protein
MVVLAPMGLVPRSYVLSRKKAADGRDKHGHDGDVGQVDRDTL